MKTQPVYLNGDWVETEETIRVVNPGKAQAFGLMCVVGRERVAQAVSDAHASFEGWRRMTGKGRGELLFKIADEMERRREGIARTLTQENGKPIGQSQGEVMLAVEHWRWFAEEARRVYGRVVPHQAVGKRHLVIKTPVGVVPPRRWWRRGQRLPFPPEDCVARSSMHERTISAMSRWIIFRPRENR